MHEASTCTFTILVEVSASYIQRNRSTVGKDHALALDCCMSSAFGIRSKQNLQ